MSRSFLAGSLLVLTIVVRGALATDMSVIEQQWESLRRESPVVACEIVGTIFTPAGGLGTSSSGAAMPASDEVHPAQFQIRFDFAHARFFREETLSLYSEPEGKFVELHNLSVFDGQKADGLSPRFADAEQRRARSSEQQVEFVANSRGPLTFMDYDLPILLAHGHVSWGNSELETRWMHPLGNVAYQSQGTVRDQERTVEVLRSAAALGEPQTYQELWVAPELGFRVVRAQRWVEGTLLQEIRLTYSEEERPRLATAKITNFSSGKIFESLDLTVKKVELPAQADASWFALQPQPYMWVLDAATQHVSQFRPGRFDSPLVWIGVLLAVALLIGTLLFWRRKRLAGWVFAS